MVARALPRLAGRRLSPRAAASPPTAETTSSDATPTPGTATVPATGQRLTQPPPLDCHRSIHLAIGPGGVLVIDTKQYRGRLQLDPSGRLWHGRYPLAPTLQAVAFEADQAAVVLPAPGLA